MSYFSGYCRSCGLCCKRPFILPEENGRIAGNLSQPDKLHLKEVGGHFILDKDPCVFLRNGECSIENEKPLCCRVFPLVLESDGKAFRWKVSEECPRKREVGNGYISKAETEGKKLLEYHNKKLAKI